ncbi:hypothetical protein [Paraferrimonas haliotis]|uniref:Uncharacterized protein n=1 Tax=Paraferrimonas haliotis TaxID=2013866 RepID=A0AA37TPU2_9GAMM|nr:hypothetical protein [Paraferrimonas haliotis]GLS83423.1 hypothetical protein GCM10007894_14000 [Paraferrimonas haliotis]
MIEQPPEIEQTVVGGATVSWVAGLVVQAAASAIKNGVKNVISGAVFGSGDPQVVNLSAESLAQIENIVAAGFDEHEKGELLSSLEALQIVMKDFYIEMENGTRNEFYAQQMYSRSTDVITHTAFDSKKPYYAELTNQYAMAASMRYAVYADLAANQDYASAELESRGNEMADELELRGTQANILVNGQVTITPQTTTNCTIRAMTTCTNYFVTDAYTGSTYRYFFADYGPGNATFAYNKLEQLRDDYKALIKGEEYQNIVDQLRTKY